MMCWMGKSARRNSLVKERPISFRADMVRAILDGRKTKTRRVVKPQPTHELIQFDEDVRGVLWCERRPGVPIVGDDEPTWRCPYGETSDRLWVKESWRIDCWDPEYGITTLQYRADGALREPDGHWPDTGDEIRDQDAWDRYWGQCAEDAQKALGDPTMEHGWGGDPGWDWEPGDGPCRWRGGRFMPRWASRITLEITDVRVERVQEISEDDVLAEGCGLRPWYLNASGYPEGPRTAGFAELWDSINAKRGYPWEDNPWVWVVEFERVEGAA